MTSERAICQPGMPDGTRAIITIGDVNGMNDVHTARLDVGSFAAVMPNTIPMIIGNITNDCN